MKVSADMLKLAEHIVESKAADFDPSELVDHYEVAVVEMLKAEAGRQTNPQGGRTGTGPERRQRHRPLEAKLGDGDEEAKGEGFPHPEPKPARSRGRDEGPTDNGIGGAPPGQGGVEDT